MKILFLGTSAGWPLPRLGCSCYICHSKDPRDKRSRPAVLVNGSILIDAPPDIYQELTKHKIDTRRLSALILTHAHYDHTLGFYDLTHLYNREGKEIKLVVTQETLKGLRQLHKLPLTPFKPEIIKANEVIKIERVRTSFFPVEHSQTPCHGIKMKSSRLFVYIPDLKRLPKGEYKKCRDVDLLVLDGSSLGRKGQTRTHQSIEEGINLAKKLRPKKCYFTHIGHITGTHEELEEVVQTKGGPNFHIAYDGLVLTL